MEYRGFQHAKLRNENHLPLRHEVAMITGAAGAIGSGIAQKLLEQGCHVAVTDLPGPRLDALLEELKPTFRTYVIGMPMDVTDPSSVARGFAQVIQTWGGVDLLVINQADALVSGLPEMDLESFRRPEQTNVEGALFVANQAARYFKYQGTGGDMVLVSPKSAAHQLARIVSSELAEIDVRVNMVVQDAVFSYRDRLSGSCAEIRPGRMPERGLDAAGLEDNHRNRNLHKATVTARHVAKAVLFFATRQTPTTGATIPVNGALPDAAPR
jgi:NAD(P)-dependent dehydrogenase (short-subunit alcohol dehydrogenase family)